LFFAANLPEKSAPIGDIRGEGFLNFKLKYIDSAKKANSPNQEDSVIKG
jgi:hypothetical protein